MAKKKAKKKRKPLEREDVHKHPQQGTVPYHGVSHRAGTTGPFHIVPHYETHAAGGSGFTMTNPALHGPFFGIGPRNYARSDQRVLEDVCDLLTQHGELDVQDVDVHCRDGVIRLEGAVPTRWMWREIEAAAESIPGVERVQNDLEVTPT